MKREKLEQMLLQVQKPAQYIGGELNSVMKDKTRVDCRLAFCFPDKYEVGMSHLGMKILYSLYNQRENWWCERVFAPDADMEALLRIADRGEAIRAAAMLARPGDIVLLAGKGHETYQIVGDERRHFDDRQQIEHQFSIHR